MTEVLLPDDGLLSAAEEIDLARRMEVGTLAAAALEIGRGQGSRAELLFLARDGEAARERYVLANVRLVAMVANSAARRSGLGFPDLFQEGVGGLITAVDRFDPDQGVRFATYALPWIRSGIARAVANRFGAVPLSEHRAERRRRLLAVAERLGQRLGREATLGEVAREARLDSRMVAELLSVEQPVALVDGSGMIFDPPDPRAHEALDAIARAEPDVRAWVRGLPAIERRVVSLRFGLDGPAQPYAGIAKTLGMAKSTVRRVEVRALERLRGMCSTEDLLRAG
ncbi:MAG: sigma-70 family RNA polymerase sigma factor [Propionibacteriaceae bacterium]|nr:sigma-70 family RNA polymerase sigma factor [Propionibacteriaceae bacterium]